MNIFLADIFDHFPSSALAKVFFFIVGIGAAVVIILTIWKLARDLFGKQPPVNSVLREINQKLNALPNTFASLELVKEMREEMKLMTPRVELAKFETDLRNRFTEFSTYEHKRIHDFGDFLESLRENLNTRGERLSAVEADVKTLTRIVHNFDGKLDRLIDQGGQLRGRAERQ
jgi:hypothetical protein